MKVRSLLSLVVVITGCGTGDQFVAIDEVPVSVESVVTTPDASTGTFELDCGRNEERHLNADNVVSSPGLRHGAHHTHEYVGNLSTDFASTDRSLAAGGTTCAGQDRSTYYWPVLRLTDRTGHDHHQQGGGVHGNSGEVLPPSSVAVSFTGSPVSEVLAMPRFLRMITGEPAALTNGGGRARWSCTGFEDRRTDRYPRCAQGSEVVRTFEFPSCWDGRNTDSASHRSHVVFPVAGGVCPPGTFPVPKLRVRVTHDVPEGRPFAIDSFPEQLRDPGTDHAMFISVFPDELMARVVDCLNAGRRCAEKKSAPR
ncbi:DUF1996 domain-containing protein [Saccharothrix coeruleofusca]|uniref:DUF1996 domain-containing protein n=1 Tax=Saccharothrix coeruleofusca TaxID=33919 RepID=A0A918AP58_9PSEU|nr:DUF1996 domain-containing protein [Saccharothrix coeruleofusca]MBP2337980.1 hypothetical protein [Saccharothrix coeruleofusca]GGP63498.1 hypothetical protein GCM10010185_40250 [Saccharothrix coeruleofusca]